MQVLAVIGRQAKWPNKFIGLGWHHFLLGIRRGLGYCTVASSLSEGGKNKTSDVITGQSKGIVQKNHRRHGGRPTINADV